MKGQWWLLTITPWRPAISWGGCWPLGGVGPLDSQLYMVVSLNGGTPISHPQNDHVLVGKPMVVGYHHFRKQPYVGSTPHPGWPNGAWISPRVTGVTNVSALSLVTSWLHPGWGGGEAQIFRIPSWKLTWHWKNRFYLFFQDVPPNYNWWFSIVMLVFGGVNVLCKITILFPFPCRARLKKALKINIFVVKPSVHTFYHGIHHHELSHHLGKYLPNSCHPTVRKSLHSCNQHPCLSVDFQVPGVDPSWQPQGRHPYGSARESVTNRQLSLGGWWRPQLVSS